MNPDEAKSVLLLYRPGTTDSDDPQIAQALAQAKRDADLGRWLEQHCALQDAIRSKFRQINVAEGLKEQIISERRARASTASRRRSLVLAAAAAVLVVGLALLWPLIRAPREDAGLSSYRREMVGIAQSGYAMYLLTNDLNQIRAYLAQQQAPADYQLPNALEKADVVGCATQNWQGGKVAMICFRTGRPLPPNRQSDLWLFVVDRSLVKDATPPGTLQLTKVNQAIAASWTAGDKLYLLGTEGDEQFLRKYL